MLAGGAAVDIGACRPDRISTASRRLAYHGDAVDQRCLGGDRTGHHHPLGTVVARGRDDRQRARRGPHAAVQPELPDGHEARDVFGLEVTGRDHHRQRHREVEAGPDLAEATR